MNRHSISAIDLGYGSTKIATSDLGGNLQLSNIPSIAIQANDLDFNNCSPEALELHRIDVNGVSYLVGSDIHQLQHTHSTRIAHFDFVNTSEYTALFKGALTSIGTDHIGLLIVGLPVNMVKKLGEKLQNKFQGTHHISGNKTVCIDKVEVLAQPIGGMIDYAFSIDSYETINDQVTLVIDPGYFTLDWVVAKGLKIFPNRSGNHAGGMHAILNALSQSLSDKLDVKKIDIASLDQGLRKGDFRLYGKTIGMVPHWEAAKSTLNDSITSLVNTVGDASDIDQIILVGGAATYLCPAINEKFPKHNVTVSDSPVYANVRGFYQAGVRYQKSRGK